MAVTLTLGGVVFSGFEIPESINFGGEQRLAVHKLPGGKRVIDAMGPDDADIKWSGRLRGASCEQRGILLDFMRRQGKKVLLTWALHRYQVVIRGFEANYQNPYEIPYSITCTVIQDEAQAIASAAVGFAQAIAADLIAATGLSDLIGKDEISTAVDGVTAAVSNYQAGVPTVTSAIAGGAAVAESTLLTGVLSSITGAQSVVSETITSATAALPTALPPAGGSASGIAATLSQQVSSFSLLNNLQRLSDSLGRMATNTVNAGG